MPRLLPLLLLVLPLLVFANAAGGGPLQSGQLVPPTKLPEQCDLPIKLIKVLFVLGQDGDGSHATGKIVGGKVVPVAPWLAPPLSVGAGESDKEIQSNSQTDYFSKWLRLTNQVLVNSNAPIRLDEADVRYDLVKDTQLNTMVFDAANTAGNAALAYFANKRADGSPDNPYRNRLIFFLPWGNDGTSSRAVPYGGGSADFRSNFVMLPGRVKGDTLVDGKPVWGWNEMVHEFAHYLGLQHTFDEAPRSVLEAVAIGRGIVNLPDGQDPVLVPWNSVDDYKARPIDPETRSRIVHWLNSLSWDDPDASDITDSAGKVIAPGVKDTGLDLGPGFAPFFGRSPCEAISGVDIGNLTGLSNELNRTNPVSYSVCPVEQMRFTPGQVKTMLYVLQRPDHSLFVTDTTIKASRCHPLVAGPLPKATAPSVIGPGSVPKAVGPPLVKPGNPGELGGH